MGLGLTGKPGHARVGAWVGVEIKYYNITFNSGSVREFPNVSQPKTRLGIRQSRMPVLSRDREEDVPEYSGR